VTGQYAAPHAWRYRTRSACRSGAIQAGVALRSNQRHAYLPFLYWMCDSQKEITVSSGNNITAAITFPPNSRGPAGQVRGGYL
jgi:hypothetical protein